MKILFTGGGTGGHLFPIIAIVREIRSIYTKADKLEFYYLGPKDEFSSLLLTQEGINVTTIFAGKVRRYLSIASIFQNIIDVFFKTPLGLLQAFFHIFLVAPDVILSKGGYGSIPAVIAGWILQVPIFLHESDVVPGSTNKFLSRFALEIFVSFPVKETEFFPQRKMIATGNPVRKEITQGSLEEAKGLFKLTGEKPIVLILGGSQGSQRINDMLLQTMPEIFMDVELIHQAGTKNAEQVKAEANVVIPDNLKKYYHPYSFLTEEGLRHAYQAASLVVSRAGSGSIFEIAAVGKPSILIPLSGSAQNHQLKNAYAYADKEAAIVIEEPNLTPHFFLERIKFLLANQPKLKAMSEAAREFSRPQAGRIIAEYILTYLG